jgi:hypothetical protein
MIAVPDPHLHPCVVEAISGRAAVMERASSLSGERTRFSRVCGSNGVDRRTTYSGVDAGRA